MDPVAKGELTEARGFKALEELRNTYPDFILEVHRASPGLDARGIDALVRICLPKGTTKPGMTVPIQFKSSQWHAKLWEIKHPILHAAGVLIFYIENDISPRKLRRLMYRALTKVQKNSKDGMLYHSLFQRIFKGRKNRSLTRNVGIIKRRRAQK